MHNVDRESLAAVDTRDAGLDIGHPLARHDKLRTPSRKSSESTALAVIATVIFVAAIPAVRVLAGARLVIVAQRFGFTAACADLCLCELVQIQATSTA